MKKMWSKVNWGFKRGKGTEGEGNYTTIKLEKQWQKRQQLYKDKNVNSFSIFKSNLLYHLSSVCKESSNSLLCPLTKVDRLHRVWVTHQVSYANLEYHSRDIR